MSLINVNVGDLEAVLAVARTGSFRGAADYLRISQPSVSARVKHAEDVLGVMLFHRTTRKVSTTEHGEALCLRAERAIHDLRELVQDFKDESRLKKGRVVVGATPTLASTILPEIIRKFTIRWPGVEVVLRDDLFDKSLDRLYAGEFDFAVMPFQRPDSKFDFETLFNEEILVVAAQDHPLMRTQSASMFRILKYPVIAASSSQTVMWSQIAQHAAKSGLELKPAMDTTHILSAFALVKAGFGVTFLPERALSMMNMDNLTWIRVSAGGLHRTISLTISRGRSLQPAAQTLMTTLRASF